MLPRLLESVLPPPPAEELGLPLCAITPSLCYQSEGRNAQVLCCFEHVRFKMIGNNLTEVSLSVGNVRLESVSSAHASQFAWCIGQTGDVIL